MFARSWKFGTFPATKNTCLLNNIDSKFEHLNQRDEKCRGHLGNIVGDASISCSSSVAFAIHRLQFSVHNWKCAMKRFVYFSLAVHLHFQMFKKVMRGYLENLSENLLSRPKKRHAIIQV